VEDPAKLTLNVGVRWDVYSATFLNANQASPRANLIYEATDSTTLHAGYSRYLTPSPLENVNSSTLSKFDNTSNASVTTQDEPIKAVRANYFGLGVSQKIILGLQVGLDGYYKNARDKLDDGLFGQTLILSVFNYTRGEIYGVEFTSSCCTLIFSRP